MPADTETLLLQFDFKDVASEKIKKFNKGLKDLGKGLGVVSKKMRDTDKAAARNKKSFNMLSKATKGVTSSLKMMLSSMGVFVGAYGLGRLATSFVDAASTAEQYRTQL